MKLILKYIGYFMAVAGFAGIIWTVAVTVKGNDIDITDLKTDVKDIKEVVIPLREQYNVIIYKVNGLGRKQDAVGNMFIQHMINDSSVTKQDIRDMMNELDVKKNNLLIH